MIDAVAQPILITLATVCTVIMIGVAFLPRPCRETAIWSIAFICAMTASYVGAASTPGAPSILGATSIGLVLLALALVWVGLRVRAGRRRVLLVPVIVGAAVVTAGLAVIDLTIGGNASTPVALGVSAVLLVATTVELVSLRSAPRTATAPLTLAAALCAVFVVVWLVSGFLQPSSAPPEVCAAVNALQGNVVAMSSVYLVSALVSVLLLSLERTVAGDDAPTTGFERLADDRLRRAERRGDTSWALLDVRLDDPAALREVSNALAFTRVLERFADDLALALPAEADIDEVDPTRFVVLLPRHDAAVLPIVRDILARISTVEAHQSIAVRLSASIGWASVSACGYERETLARTAADAADEAQRAGGDRWEHAIVAGGGPVESLG